MGHVHEDSGPRRWRPRRLAFAATAMLAGCATVTRDTEIIEGFRSTAPDIFDSTRQERPFSIRPAFRTRTARSSTATTAADGLGSSVLLRMGAEGHAMRGDLLERSELWNMDTGRRLGTPGRISVSAAARAAGWRHEAALPPGRYFLRLLAPDRHDATPTDLTFMVPSPPPPVLYIGSFRVECPAVAPCRVAAAPADESDAARALVAAQAQAPGTPVTRLAQRYPAAIASTGLPTPSAPEIRVDTRFWLSAIDWNAITRAGGVPTPPAEGATTQVPERQSSAPEWTQSHLISVSGDFSAEIAAYAVMLVVVVPIHLISRAIVEDQRVRRSAAESRRLAETLRAAALAQEQWNPCAAGIAATLAPDKVERDLRATLSPRREEGRRASLPDPWNVTVSRVIFRHCGTQPDHHGVEVATRWTARRAGEADPAFDIAFTRSVAGATRDSRLVHSERPPWELPVASEAACRPLATYCGAAGAALLREEVLRGVTEARDAVAVAR